MRPYLARIRIFPIKSLGPCEVDRARVVEGAGLAGDREYALFSSAGRCLNAKRLGAPLISIRADYAAHGAQVALGAGADSGTFDLPRDREGLDRWFSGRLRQPVSVRRNAATGFQDDPEASGPTVVGSASLAEVAAWAGIETEECRRRFRANLEIRGLEPFEEDRLFGPPSRPRRFRIGAVEFFGINPCRRCVVPSFDSRTGALQDPQFAKRFAGWREGQRQPNPNLAAYGGFYRLAVNTVLAAGQGGRELAVGDVLRFGGPQR